ncbi:MAG: hypothetical protein ACKO2D_05015, partial [Chloroflexota bacterium]
MSGGVLPAVRFDRQSVARSGTIPKRIARAKVRWRGSARRWLGQQRAHQLREANLSLVFVPGQLG